MINSGLVSTSRYKKTLMLFVFTLLGLICSSAVGHEWTIDGKKVKAKVLDHSLSHVLLEDAKGNRHTLELKALNSEDMQYLSDLLSIKNAQIQQHLEQQQIRQQQIQTVSEFVDIWTVSLLAANGERGWSNYFAVDSFQAMQLAAREFPSARIIGVQKVRRRGFGGRGGNLGMASLATQLLLRR